MKFYNVLVLAFCLIISSSAIALKSNEANQPEYIKKHGHSDEISRIIELQKARLEPEKPEHMEVKTSNRFIKFFKNLFYERDISMPLNNFGNQRVRTVESPER